MADMLYLFLFCLFFAAVCNGREHSAPSVAYVSYDINRHDYTIVDSTEPGNFVAKGVFRNEVNTTGWSLLEVSTSESYSDDVQAYAAGLVEGYLTADFIKMQWYNTIEGYCDKPYTAYCTRLQAYLQQNLDWMNRMISKSKADPYWNQVKLYLLQVSGVSSGYFYPQVHVIGQPTTKLDPMGMYFMQISGDLEDLEGALHKPTKSHVLGSGSCSALVKLLPGAKDLFVSHDTWSSYMSMLRVLKKYDLPFHDSQGKIVPAQTMSFSSYPGSVMSGDDYYLLSSGLVSMETTIGNSNDTLWSYIHPTESVPEGIRSMVANRIARTGKEWVDAFAHFNSGTYNNEWMVVDYKQFVPGRTDLTGVLYVLEQIPGLIEYEDLTPLLMKQTYWPSYNVPYFDKVFNMSGMPDMVEKYGDWFTWDKTPRALIFGRDHHRVVDLDSMIKLMRYNDFTHDPLSRCNCTPPYSAENAISARCDLNPASGSYPISALGHRSHGGTDMKVTSAGLFQAHTFVTVSGPTSDQQPPFQWSTADFADECPHAGHPDIFNFDPIQFDGTVNYKPYPLYKPEHKGIH
ncbi:putative phospholipase B-like 2 [Mizuhopecten yessoensis]|uniref:Phospholipase B-like n=1 Tax=Mizuhopecten yessoensis TaxID=6573 RepID=A0A210QBW5_MIZYE|nr:putative phospholipase B-like 2 [Mizuhopecten yessoensis]OWF46224.1 phospholipase B-like 2 [Mizuhopecten yessoensis]